MVRPRVELAILDYLLTKETSDESEESDENDLVIEESLYERLGGIFPIALIIDDFSNALIQNPIVGANPLLRDWNTNKLNRLPGLKWLRTLWLADISGGPYTFEATRSEKCPLCVENSHADLHITPAEFDAFIEELRRSLNKFSIPSREREEVIAAFEAHKSEILLVD
jgi:hemoglobin